MHISNKQKQEKQKRNDKQNAKCKMQTPKNAQIAKPLQTRNNNISLCSSFLLFSFVPLSLFLPHSLPFFLRQEHKAFQSRKENMARETDAHAHQRNNIGLPFKSSPTIFNNSHTNTQTHKRHITHTSQHQPRNRPQHPSSSAFHSMQCRTTTTKLTV